MSRLRRAANAVVVLGLGGLIGPACLSSRHIVELRPDEAGTVMLMQTHDLYSYGLFEQGKRVFWRCVETRDELRCVRECDGQTDLKCAGQEVSRP